MPIKMIAARRHYAKADGKEYTKGQPFDAADDREAARLEKMGRARRADVSPIGGNQVPQDHAANLRAGQIKAEESGVAPRDVRGRNRYRRSDLQSED